METCCNQCGAVVDNYVASEAELAHAPPYVTLAKPPSTGGGAALAIAAAAIALAWWLWKKKG